MKMADKGQIRIIEAFLAVLIIFSAFAVSGNLPLSQNLTRSNDLASVGLGALIQLDSSSILSKYIEEENWSSLRDALCLLLPSGIAFNLTVYNDAMQQINDEIISNGGLSSENNVSVKYISVSQGPTFRHYILYLYLAVAI